VLSIAQKWLSKRTYLICGFIRPSSAIEIEQPARSDVGRKNVAARSRSANLAKSSSLAVRLFAAAPSESVGHLQADE
jgi:hypothetical protein